MFGPVNPNAIPPEVCTANCPRIYPPIIVDEVQVEGGKAEPTLPEEFNSEVGKKIYPERLKPCYLFILLTRPFCRSLRNYIISNSSKLEVIDGSYCGISTKVFNVNNHTLENNMSVGLIRFKTTAQAFRFISSETKMGRQEFLGGKFDIWNLSLCAEDQSIIPNPSNPDKVVNHMNVFHFVHIKKIALIPDFADEVSDAMRQEAEQKASAEKQQLEQCLATVEQFEGRVVVQTNAMVRMRGLPLTNKATEPQKFVYMTQWKGVYYFWKWFDSEHGRKFLTCIKDYTNGDYQSLLFTCCLDFHDLM